MDMANRQIAELQKTMVQNNLFDRFNLNRVGVFGSAARGEQTNDIDVLIEDNVNYRLLSELRDELERLMNKRIDVVIARYANPIVLHRARKGVVMLKLTKPAFDKAKEYIFSNATPIEKAWFRYNFEESDTNAFMEELAKYQFDNGGFGGLVYEFEYQGPCLKCTEHAFRYIYYLKDKPKAEHPVIQKMMRYVLECYHPETGCWGELLEPEVNDSLHVWWWTYGEDEHQPTDDFDERVKQYNPNGQAALAAFVALYSELVPEDLYKDIIRYPIEKILRYYDNNSPLRLDSDTEYFTDVAKSPYNMKCLQQFCDCLKDKKLATRLKNILRQDPTACMELDESVWGNGYHETPWSCIKNLVPVHTRLHQKAV